MCFLPIFKYVFLGHKCFCLYVFHHRKSVYCTQTYILSENCVKSCHCLSMPSFEPYVLFVYRFVIYVLPMTMYWLK